VASHDPDIASAAARVAAAEQVARLDAAGRRWMTESARSALKNKYLDRAREQLGEAADLDEIAHRAGHLRRLDLRRSALRGVQARRAAAADARAEREALELDQLIEVEAST
jgi:hypothetical protein